MVVRGRIIEIVRSWVVPGWGIVVIVLQYIPWWGTITTGVRGSREADLVWGDEEIREEHGDGSCVNRIVGCIFRNIYSADLSIIIVTGTDVPEVREVIEAMGYRLKLGYAVSTKLLVEGDIISYLPNMQRTRE